MLDVREPGRVRLGAQLELLEIGYALGMREPLADQDALVCVEVRRRERHDLRPLRGDRDLLEREVVLFRRRREQPAERCAYVNDLLDSELLGDLLRERILETGWILDRRPRHPAVPESWGGHVEADRELPSLLGRDRRRPGKGRRRSGQPDDERERYCLHHSDLLGNVLTAAEM